jgi:DNA-binding NarL/FixJ family response regulator
MKADVALVDISMPGRDGLHPAPILHWRNPDLKILPFSGSPEEKYRARMDQIGLEQFLPKPFTIPEMEEKIGLLCGFSAQ